MNKQKGFVPVLIAIIIIIALGVGGYVYRDKLKTLVSQTPSNEQGSGQPITAAVTATQLNISLESSKTEYKVGEPFTGVKVVVANSGDRFNALIMITPQKEGITKMGGRSSNRIYLENENQPTEGNSAKFDDSLRAFHLDNQSYSMPNNNTFDGPGSYSYIVDVFNCQDIESKLGKECGGGGDTTNSIAERINQNDIKPLLSKTFSFNVVSDGVNKPVSKPSTQQSQKTNNVANSDIFPDKLSLCTKYKTTFVHPLTGKTLEKEILGIIGGKCDYVEQMPNNGKMECKYTEQERKVAAQYYRDAAATESDHLTFTTDKGVTNPLQEALDNGVCVISGY